MTNLTPVRIVLFVALALVFAWAAFALPLGIGIGDMLSMTNYATLAILALSAALVWGIAGIVAWGQAAFFGIAAYAYAVVAINLGDTTLSAIIAVAVATAFAVMVGYFLFWGRVSSVYSGVITLTIALILFSFFNQTAGDEWRIGKAALGGFNGIPATPLLTYPGHPNDILSPRDMLGLAVFLLVALYFLVRWMLTTRFGRIVVAIRENETRAELLGYDTRLYKLAVFVIGGAFAGIAGVLFANSVFVSPPIFSLKMSGEILIWVVVGGLGTLIGPIVACIALSALASLLGTLDAQTYPILDPTLVLGLILTAFVIVCPQGVVPWLRRFVARLRPQAAPGRRSGIDAVRQEAS